MYNRDKLLNKLQESWNKIVLNESMPPGAAQMVSDISDLPTEDEILHDMPVTEQGLSDAPVKDVDPTQDIARTKTLNPNIAQGIKDIRAATASKKTMGKQNISPEDKATAKLQKDKFTPQGEWTPAERPQRLIHSSAMLTVLTPEGDKIDGEKLRQLISVRPTQIIGQNKKLAGSGAAANEVFYDLTLPAYQGLFFNEKLGKFQVVKTCPAAGACKAYCYATSGGYVQYKGLWLSSTRTINFLMNDYEGFKAQVIAELTSAQASAAKQGKKVVLRWHDAGDFYSETYLLMAFDIARQTPNVRHYAYTKQVDMVNKHSANKPNNFIFNFSKGGTQDAKVDFDKSKHSKVVPYVLFKDLTVEKGIPLTPEDKSTIIQRLAHHYSLDPKTIITYDDLVKIPTGTTNNKYNVIVRPGDGDDAAARDDVLGTYLLIH